MSRIADAWRLRKRDGVWYVHGTEAGRYFRRSTKKTDQREALAVLKEWQKDPERAARPSGDVTFADMEAALWRHYRIADRRSAQSAEYRVRFLRKAFGEKAAHDISAGACKRYIDERLSQGVTNATVRYEMTLLVQMLKLCECPVPTFTKPSVKGNARKGFFEPEQREAVLVTLPEDVRPLATAIALMGWRPSEVNGLRWRDVDVRRGVVRVEQTKNDEPKEFPIGSHPRLLALFKAQRERAFKVGAAKLDHFVFFRTTGDGRLKDTDQEKTRTGKPRTKGIPSFRKVWRTACKVAGVKRCVYDFKRSVVRDLVGAGVDRKTAMTITGHKTESIFERYHIVSNADQKRAVAEMARVQEVLRKDATADGRST
jgi:integrase